MSYVVLKRTGQKMPLVGFGLWKVTNATCADTVYKAINAGYRLFDGAGDYGNEKEAGEGVAKAIADGIVKREDLFITSKLWNTFHAHDHAKALAKHQLKLWGIDYFDLFLVHFPIALQYVDPAHRYPPEWWGDDKKVHLQNTPFQETWRAMEELVDEGLAKNIGISNCQGSIIRDITNYARIEPQVLQIEIHPYLTQEAIIKYAKTLGIAVTGYSSFGPQSYVELGVNKPVTGLLQHDVISAIAKTHGRTTAQVILRWTTQQGVAVIPKSNNTERLVANLNCDDFNLTDEDMRQISSLNINLRCGDPTRKDDLDVSEAHQPGRETRRISFPTQPSWHALETRIASLFDIPHGNVAASYEDNDGDIITLSSHEELYEYFANYHVIYHRQGEPIRFNVIDTRETRRPAREGVSSNFVEEISINEEAEGEVPTLGPTMVFEVGDTDWQHLPRMPNIFGMHDGEDQPEFEQAHAYVEVVDSDAVSSKQGSEPAHSVHASPRPGSHESRRRDTGKNRAISDAKSTSTTSISENQSPAKQAVHIYNVSDAGGSPRIAPMRVGSEHFSQQRYLAFGSGASDHNRNRDSDHTGSIGPESTSGGRTPQTTPRQAPTLDLETPPPVLRQLQPASEASASSDESAAYPSRPAFSRDVASLIDGLTEAFASHPELSEGMRNIVRNAVEGRYWETERDRVASAAEAVRAAAEDTSGRISRAARDIAYSERDAVKRIAEALGGVFRVIGQLSSSRNDEVNSTSSRIGDHLPPAGGPPRAPEPSPRDPGLPSHGSPHPHRPPGDWHTFGGPPPPPLHGDPFDRYRAAPPFSSRFPYHRHHRHPQARPDHLVDPENPFAHPPAPPPPGTGHFEGFPVPPHQGPSPRNYEQMMHDPRGTWATGSYAPVYYGGSSREPYGIVERPSIHESKAQLEAAKAVYKAEKERFRQEKEERRRMRHEFAERRAEEGRAARIDGTIREETIIARIPLPGSSTGPSEQPYAEIYSVPPQPASAEYTTPAAQVQYAPSVSLPRSQAASTHTASVAPPPPPSPSSAPVMSHAPIIPLQHEQAVPAPFAPLPWPMPTRTGASRRAGLSRLQDRIIARLFEMGITASSQPKMMDIVNEHANRVNIDEEEALRGVIEALEINGSPSPRPSASHLPH